MAAAAGDPVTLQVVLAGAPDGSLSTAFIQRKSGVPVGDPLPALYASQQLLNSQPYVSGALHGGSAGSRFRSALDHRLADADRAASCDQQHLSMYAYTACIASPQAQ
jgi:hypothetical protein